LDWYGIAGKLEGMPTLPAGTLVVPSPSYRATMDTGEGAALLLGTLRGSGKLYYPSTDRTFWVPLRKVRPIPHEVVPEDSLERLLSDLVLILEAVEGSVTNVAGNTMALELEVPHFDCDRLVEITTLLGERLTGWVMEPGSMRALLLKLDLAGLPAAVGAGR